MNTPTLLDGVAIAAEIKAEVALQVQALAEQGIRPGLAVILVGNVAASEIYVRSKVKTCGELGIHSEMLTPPESVTTEELLAMVDDLNRRDEIDGILIQLPLPAHVDTKKLLEAVSPAKDVDGFHPGNVGRLQSGQPGLAALHAGRSDGNASAPQHRRRGKECGRSWAQRHRRQAYGDAAAERVRHGDRLPLENG